MVGVGAVVEQTVPVDVAEAKQVLDAAPLPFVVDSSTLSTIPTIQETKVLEELCGRNDNRLGICQHTILIGLHACTAVALCVTTRCASRGSAAIQSSRLSNQNIVTGDARSRRN